MIRVFSRTPSGAMLVHNQCESRGSTGVGEQIEKMLKMGADRVVVTVGEDPDSDAQWKILNPEGFREGDDARHLSQPGP